MKLQHYIAIAIKIFALLLLIYTVRTVIWVIEDLLSQGFFTNKYVYYQLGAAFMLIAINLACWFLPMSLAKVIVKPAWNKQVEPINAESFLRALIIFLGLFLFIFAFIHGARLMFQMYLIESMATGKEYVNSMNVSLAMVITQLTIGLLLISKNYWITQTFLKINAPETTSNQED